MAADTGYICGVKPCSNRKGENNHWFVATVSPSGQSLKVEKFKSAAVFERAANKDGVIKICSEACLHIHIGRWAEGKLSPPVPE